MNDRVEVAPPVAIAGAAEPSPTSYEAAERTVVARLYGRAKRTPERLAYTWLADGEAEAESLTWGALQTRAAGVARGLAAAGVVPGDRALLLFPPGLEFLGGFFGCLLAGVVAVPAYPPRSLRRPEREGERLAGVAADAAPRAVLTTPEIAAAGPSLAGGVPALLGLPWLAFSGEPKPSPAGVLNPASIDPASIGPNATAFLQYTSGSTSEPKGVIVSHANLAANLRMIQEAFGQDERSIVVGWLPLYHDMGLIGNVLQPLWSGGRCVLMSPVSFLQRPARWLEAISRYRATTSGGPDFAYALAARKVTVEEAERLNLSSWQVAFSGAEPVRAETLAAFAGKFAGSGFRREAFYPCYGLAEATLFVAGPERGRPPRIAELDAQGLEAHEVVPAGLEGGGLSRLVRSLVSCGHAWAGQRLAIVDPENARPCPPGRIGEIWMSGPSIAAGYRNRPEANAATFGARLAGSAEVYLRTGDLGFLHEGELFVTGRLKDLVILRGRNHYPQDLERTAEAAHPDLVVGNSAAFSVEGEEGERLVLVAEVSRHVKAGAEEIVEAIRTAIAERHEVQAADVRLLTPGALPKTTSGKVRRGAARAAYLAGGLAEIEARPLAASEKAVTEGIDEERASQGDLVHAAARVLRLPVERLDVDRPLTAQGLDSLSGIEFQLAAEKLGYAVSIADLLDCASLADLRRGSALTPGPSPRGRGEKDAPLSLEQEALWAAERLAPGAYTIAVAATVEDAEDLDSEALVRAVEAAIARHPALGARFSDGEAGAVQTFAPPRLETIRERLEPARFTERIGEIVARPFDLGVGPLVRLVLIEGKRTAIGFAVHHLVADFTSLALLAGEVAAIYSAEVAARLPKLPPLSAISLGDLIAWRNERLATLDRGPESAFAARLAALSAAEDLDLPTDRPRPPRQSFRGFLRSRPLSAAAALGLERLARSSGTTPFALLTGAFSAFLHRTTGQSRFALAAPTSGRTSPGLETLVGYLVQPAAIPVELEDDPSFAVHLERTRRASAAAVASAESVPFATLVERLRPRRDPARPPLAQVAVAYERAGDLAAFGLGIEGAEIDLGGVCLRALPLPERRVPFELALHAAQVGETLHLALQGNAELFDPATIGRWLGQLGRLLADMAERPAARLSELHLFSAAERAELLAAAAGPHRPAPPSAAIQLDDLVAHWEAATPEALAVADPAGSLTYGELGARANRLAWRLRQLGIAEESRVAVCLDRSVDLIVAELAALRAGAAFAPIDPAYPEARRGDMVALSGAAAVVTRSHLAGSWCGAAPILALDAEPALWSTEPVAAPPRRKNPEGLAYAIFTSGSTGRPKGVAMSHRGALHIVSWHLERFGWTSADRGSQVSGPSFDAAVIEIWPALASGASLHVPPADVRLSAPDLLAWFARERLTVAWSSTPLVELFAGEPQPAGLRLRFLQTGGDRLLQGAPADARYVLCNQYGPAENAVITTQGESVATDGRAGAVPSIGRPISGVRAYVLDRWQGLAPRGSGGELGVVGEGLARGYLDDPAQTAERFVPDPFSGETGGRMYRTGDRARQRPDGALDFLGRIDRQVKIRGQRIELGEIEAALLAEPQVAAATVVLFGAGAGARLAAFVVPHPGSMDFDRLRGRLRSRLRERLPDAMVPSSFVELAALPLTPNGKIDRRALPAPQFGGEVGESFELARSPAEEILASIFGEVLGVERPIGRHDDLLALGLHSLTATRAAARVARVMGREIPLAALFENPTIGALAEKLTEGGVGGVPLPAIVAGGRGERSPLTFPQRRLWFLERLQPGRATYHVAGAVDLSGERNEGALDGALSVVIARHDALRMAIPDEEGEPFQVPAAEVFVGCPRIDLTGLGAGEAETERLSRSLACRPFDIAAGPLARFAEIVQGKTRARLVAIFHHLICDGAALDLFLGELWTAYAALAARSAPNLPPVEIQLADVARWQLATVTPERTEEPLTYFRSRLADLEPLDLPSNRPRGARRSGRGQTVAARFDGGLDRRLATRARSAGATPFMFWVAALQVLIARISGRAKTAIGTPIANRRSPELERVFGFVANTLVLDAETGDDPTAAELIDRVRVGALAAYSREDLPFELLVEALAPRRDVGQNPLFDVLISLEPPLSERQVGGLTLIPRRLDTATAKLDLSLAVVPAASGFEVWAEHDAELFDSTTIARWLGGYERLLGALADGTSDRVSELPLLAAEEIRQLLLWSGEEKIVNEGELLHARFFSQAERAPNAPAIVAAEGTWTYGELAARALAIAGSLANRGVVPEERVGVLLHRGPELVAALFGVLAAGGAYVPLDPAYPEERLRFLLEDSGARICLTERGLAKLVPEEAVVLLEDLGDGEKGAASSAPTTGGGPEIAIRTVDCRGAACCAPLLSPRHLAYLIYTSGSTGRPKSVAIEHGTAAGFISWAISSFSPLELLSVLFSTSVCFDLSIFELFAPLSSGGALVLAENALDLPAAAGRAPVTLINTVPSALAELVRSEGLPPSVVTVNLAGEALPGALVERIFASSPNVARVNNLYGPSEDTTYSTWGEIRRGEKNPAPPIGRPLPGTQGYVVGRQGELTIPGVPGELRLGGAGQARGYLGRPDLTAERFLPDPFANVAGARLYATGDRVRWIARGEDRPELEYLGRVDHQVKVRGFRVELGEVEAALAAVVGVREAAAAVVGVGAERRLIGFVATNREVRFDEGGLLAALRSRLPEYLVPTLLTPLDALPRLPNGKVDRHALPALGGAAGQRLYVPPRGPVEGIVAEIFAEVLESAPHGGEPAAAVRIGAHDGFFALGGHSLLAARAVSRLRATFGVELPLKRLFERPTVAQIAEEIERRRADGPAEAAAPLRRLPAGAERPLSFAQERLWFLDRLGAGAAYNLPGAVRLTGPLRPAVLRAALAEVVRRHEGLRSRFPERQGRPILEIAPPAVVVRQAPQRLAAAEGARRSEEACRTTTPSGALPLTDLAALAEAVGGVELRRLARAEAALPFDLAAGPLVRARLVRLAEDRHVVLFNHHHAVSDGWSIGLLLDEIGRLYSGLAVGGFAALPELPIEVADFAAWQRARLAPGSELDRLLGFWRGELAGVPTVLDLPTDRPRPGVFSTRGLAVPVSLGRELSADLAAFCRSRGATPFALLLAGFGALLGRWVEPAAGRAPLVLGTPIAGRDRPEIERLIGFFANILPLRIDRIGADGTEGSFGALLDRVRARALDAFSHPDLPFDVLVEDLVPRRDPSRPPLVQAALNWQAVNPWHGARWGDLELSSLGGFGGLGDFGAMAADGSAEVTAKFELMLVLERGSEGIAGHLEVHADLFERTTALRWAGQFERLLAAAVADPDGTAWGDLALLSAEERHQLLVEWRAGADPEPVEPWHERVAGWAARAPDRPAAFLGDATLTYGALDERSRALAARLQALGLAPEDRVAIALERSFEALIAILGILRAGCAYVAIDPDYPAERIAFLLGDSGARALVRGFRRLGDGWDGIDLPVVTLDGAPVGSLPPLAPIRFDPGQLAYIVYTSGSTGVPKGVATPHRAVEAYVAAQTALLGIGPDDCMLQFSPLGFDGSVEEIFAPLAAGASLALRGADLPGARELLRIFAERRVSVTFLPTGYWNQLAAAIAAEDLEIPATLREIRFGGEQGFGETAREIRRRAPGLSLANAYGPTETTVIITHWALPEAAEIPATLPLGRPIPHARMAVVDGALRPVPRGAVGELVFGGPSLARGYWARPDLAADRFVPDPFSGAEGRGGERLYRTGDLARLAPDGTLEFLGRAEGAGGQVKLRGFRIELGEVEAALAGHPQAAAAVAAVVKKAGQEDRLVAWVAASPAAALAPSSADLASYLAERLPAQLIPSGIVVLAELPLNANGKVDRRALPPFEEAKERTFPDRPADGSLEATLAGIWAELFGAAGPDDNFFDLGASSLSLVRLHSRIQADLGREFPLVTLFQHPTLRSLAKSLGQAGTSAAAEREAAEVSAARERSAGRREGLAELERRRSRARRRV